MDVFQKQMADSLTGILTIYIIIRAYRYAQFLHKHRSQYNKTIPKTRFRIYTLSNIISSARSCNVFLSVSYTHLDVYKRQV